MERIEIVHSHMDQNKILFWGVKQGYCGTIPGMPVNFLAGTQCTLTDEEKADCIEKVMQQIGGVKRTIQTQGAFNVIEHRRNSCGGGQPDSQGAVS